MTDYKSTLNLPQTDFPMKANLAQREPEILKKWADLNLYQSLRDERRDAAKFILHMGPPYANGPIHMGTALNTILKDIVAKSKTMSGLNAPLVPGWDCHGLPIELNVEKKVGKPGVKIAVEEFRAACREYAQGYVNQQREELKRLGVHADWQNPYLTMSYSYEANIIRSLAKIIQNGHLQKGYKPVHWCLDCASALAEAEVEYADKSSLAIDVRFKFVDPLNVSQAFNVADTNKSMVIPIWTTTAWTLPANQAVALNSQIEYSLIESANEYLIVASALVTATMERYQIQDYKILSTVQGEALAGLMLHHPFYEKIVPVIMGDHVTIEAGTGAVHTAPAHGQDDYVVGKLYQLPLENPVGDNGCYTQQTPLFAGEHVNRVTDHIMAVLEENHALLHVEKIVHSYPHCWRHKTPLIFRSTPQWFISMDQNGLRTAALGAIDRVEWLPDWGKNRITAMIEKRPDWCISRQRTWGVPIPLFIHRETDDIHPASVALMLQIADQVESHGVDAWFNLDASSVLNTEADKYKKCQDILDVWFDSGVSHECVLRHWPDVTFPADMYLEGSDQHRGWFNSSLLSSLAMNHVEPFKTVLTHGYVIDVKGQKMSKSLGNVIAPEKITQTLGADVLRLWVSSVDYRTDINVSDEILTRISDAYRRIRNTSRFLLANLVGFNPQTNLLAAKDLLALDAFMINKTRAVQEEIIHAYALSQFHVVYQKIYHFCSVELGSFYLDIIKDRQYTTQENSTARRSAQTALFHITHALTRWIAPILSFTAEEIWQFVPGEKTASIFQATWYENFAEGMSATYLSADFWLQMQAIRNAVNKEIENQRASGKVGSSLEAHVILHCSPELKASLDQLENELRFVLITSAAEVTLAQNVDALLATDVAGLWLTVLPMDGTKCERCWHRRPEIGASVTHPTLCARCIENIDGAGEVRKYA